ncbi:sugar ABC transporter permease [Defluviitalea saccharophila]|uniref:Sugar ABC transporter permease n=1 Tax=Defluviitalea saccharophila TaxID=879970 RepID=A0ABZ2Y2Z6_9FIRM
MKTLKLTESRRDILSGYIYVLPALIFMLVLIGYPIVYNFLISFQKLDAMNINSGVREFIGFENYKKVLSDEVMGIAFKNTFIYTIASLAFQFTIGFALALFFNNKFKLAKPIRGFMVISYMMPITVTALMFKFMLSPSNGIINDIMVAIGIIDAPIPWLLQESTALWGLIIANSWIGIPFNMLLLTTGLSNISEEIYESASVDGANGLQKFIHITLPLLKPAILSVLMLGFVYTFKVFDLVFVMTSGGPVNSTEVLSTFSYRLSFKYYYFGQGAAVANILFLCLFAVALVYLKMIGKEEV